MPVTRIRHSLVQHLSCSKQNVRRIPGSRISSKSNFITVHFVAAEITDQSLKIPGNIGFGPPHLPFATFGYTLQELKAQIFLPTFQRVLGRNLYLTEECSDSDFSGTTGK